MKLLKTLKQSKLRKVKGGVMDIKKELNAMMDITLKPEFELAINEVIEKSYKADIEKLGPSVAGLVKSQWEKMKPCLFFAYCLGAKAQAVPEGFVLVPKELSIDAIKNLDDEFIEVVLKDDEDYQDIYKAMIEAQEQSHD